MGVKLPKAELEVGASWDRGARIMLVVNQLTIEWCFSSRAFMYRPIARAATPREMNLSRNRLLSNIRLFMRYSIFSRHSFHSSS